MKFIKKTLSSLASNAIIAFVLAKSGVSLTYGKIREKAGAANMTLKEYVGNEDNIGHISLVFYDVLPLALKLGLRYEKFHDEFASKFKTIRSWIYKYDEQNKEKIQDIAPVNESAPEPSKVPRKRVAKKKTTESQDKSTVKTNDVVKAPTKRNPVKRAAKKIVMDSEK